MLRILRYVLLVAIVLTLPARAWATPFVIDFESLSELDSVTTQFPGLVFSNATVLTAGSLLNEIELPPHSGVNVVLDDGGPISIVFTSPVLTFGAFFTYAHPLTLSAFDSSSLLLGSTPSASNNNEAVSGDSGSSPNEFLKFTDALGISSVTIAGDLAGGSFVMDDVTITDLPATVPEPTTLSLILGGVVAAGVRRHTVRLRLWITHSYQDAADLLH
jgi:hypothetical protein